jgi:CubicO group peptidase (beta-lactamase class C family)
LDACAEAFHFSGAVVIAQNGKRFWSGACGLANIEHDVPNTEKTKFRIASITKQITAMAILILHEQGKINIFESITKYVPHAPKHWKKITVHHLLTNTSGIPSYTDFPDHLAMAKNKTTPEQLVASFRDKELGFRPGEKFEYSNSGYALLGAIIEAVSGQSYGEFLADRIFKPLGMKGSGCDDNELILELRASGYVRTNDGGLRNASYLDMSVPYSAGGLYSTVKDLLRWERGLMDGSLISKASTKMMFKPEKDGYAYGWFVKESGGRTTVGHAGGIDGFTSNIERVPQDGLCTIVLSNVQDSPVALMTHDLKAIVFGEPYELPRKHRAVKVKASVFETYAGRYELGEGFIVTVSRVGDGLVAHAPGQAKVQLVPTSESDFSIVEIYAQLTFCTDESNEVTHFVFHQNGYEQYARKIN